MLYCINLNPRVNYILQSSKYAVTLNSFNSIQVNASLHHVVNINTNHTTAISHKSTLHSVNDAHSKGMILVILYAEQQVGAAMNMFSLQKWAKFVGASVVEPFVENSMFKLPIVTSQKQLDARLRFRDYFDINIYNNMSIVMNGTPLIPWETFIDQAPKKYIFVAILNSLRKVERPIYIEDEIMEQELCNGSLNHLTDKYSFYIDHLLQARLVRRVCLSFYNTIMDIDKFTDIIYGNFNPSDVIVWFQVWKGFAHHDRVRVLQEHYFRSKQTFTMLHTSKRISDDSEKYIRKFLKSEPGKYTAISMRTITRAKSIPRSSHQSFFDNCIKKLGSVINSTSTIFVAIDLGRFGDRVENNFVDKFVIKNIETEVFRTLYNNSLTLQKWEQSFIQVTNGIRDSGYIATMQRTIVENGQCLVLFGGKSNFQRTLLLTYKEKHINKTCIYEVCYKQ